MDFLIIGEKLPKKDGSMVIYPKFRAKKSNDLMIRGGDFYAVWDENKGLWSTNQDDVVDMIDAELDNYKKSKTFLQDATVLHMWDSDSGQIDKWHKYVQKQLRDNYHPLNEKLVFSNSPVNKEDYASKRLPYPLEESDISSYDELMSTLYSEKERKKIEWAIGSVVSGDSKKIQKFLVFYGSAGTGKSTVLNIIQDLFQGYYTTFDAKALGSNNDAFALEAFKNDPLVAIQHDGDLSRIENNARLNSVVSHEEMTINEKFKTQYTNRFHCMLFIGTNKPVRITDSKSGLIRRLIDVSPTENTLPIDRYRQLMEKIKFELGGIAYHCLKVYENDKYAYEDYIPQAMIGATNDFYNFMEEMFDEYVEEDSVTLNKAWSDYKRYCDDAKIPFPYKKMVFKEELKNYFHHFDLRGRDEDGNQVRNYYHGFDISKFGEDSEALSGGNPDVLMVLDKTESIFDEVAKDYYAQYAVEDDEGRIRPVKKWANNEVRLKDIDTTKLHYVKLPENHIVIDFDLKDEKGNKSKKLNLEAASNWPETYAEFSKSGAGIHLHYIYNGDVSMLEPLYDEDIEIKVFNGNSSLRRQLSYCNDLPIATISSGLPLKKGERKKMVDFEGIKSEKALRTLIKKNLNKEIHESTKPSIDFIYKILTEVYESDLYYDVSDMRTKVLAFANNSTNQSDYCVKLVNKMPFKSEDVPKDIEFSKEELIFFDVEVFPNLFVVVWKRKGHDPVKMINPSPKDIEQLVEYKLVGFNNRRYDNHILYARMVGYTNKQLYKLSQKIVSGDSNAMFGGAYNLSYTDVYDFSSKKQSLKKFEIELGIHHQELGLRWDEEVPEDLWPTVADYCANDVIATEAVFDARHEDFLAREILVDLANLFVPGSTVNNTSNNLTEKIILRGDKRAKDHFEYTDLSKEFPGYIFDSGKSTYRNEEVGEGGYVYSEPNMYGNVALLDIASMHPTSIIQLNLLGPYTDNFKDLLDIRLAIKHKDYDKVKTMFDGKLAKYVKDKSQAKALSNALKIPINSVYGLTAANFDNPFRDIRNVDNIVAKRGALFMIDLKHAVMEKGYTVAHIKTDSIKIPDATPDIIKFVTEFGAKYGYIFEHEATYDKMCLVNDAVYIARVKEEDGEPVTPYWTATGTQFQVPYVFKKLFSKEDILFEDLCETKSVTSALYLDNNENLPDVSTYEKVRKLREILSKKGKTDMTKKDISLLEEYNKYTDEKLSEEIAKGHDYIFVGKTGAFCPIKPGKGGCMLMREKDGKYYHATGTKNFRWLEAELVKELGKEKDIDERYYEKLAEDAKKDISKYGSFDWFISDEPYKGEFDVPF